MNFDKKKIVICFFVILIFLNNLGFKNVKANPAVVPLASEVIADLLVTVAGCLGVELFFDVNDYDQLREFNKIMYNNMSEVEKQDYINKGLYIDDNYEWRMTDAAKIKLKKENEIKKAEMRSDLFLLFAKSLKNIFLYLKTNGLIDLKYSNESFEDLNDILNGYNAPDLYDIDSVVNNMKYENLYDLISDDSLCILSVFSTSLIFTYVEKFDDSFYLSHRYYDNNVLLFSNIDSFFIRYYFYFDDDCWRLGVHGSANMVVGEDLFNGVLWCNQILKFNDSDDLVGNVGSDVLDGYAYDDDVYGLGKDNIFDLDLDDVETIVSDILDTSGNDVISLPIPDVVDDRYVVEPLLDIPFVDKIGVPDVVDVPVDGVIDDIVDVPINETNIFDWFSSFWDNLLKFVKSLFIVDDLYFVEKIDCYKQKLTDILNLDFSFFDTFNNLSDDDFKDIRININGNNVVIVDFSNLNKFRGYFKALISGVVEIFFWFFNYRQLVWLIRKSTVFGGSSERNEKR